MNNWISVNDKFPEDGTNLKFSDDFGMKFTSVLVSGFMYKNSTKPIILIANRSFTKQTGITYLDSNNINNGIKLNEWCWSRNLFKITHWQPLPKQPTDSELTITNKSDKVES